MVETTPRKHHRWLWIVLAVLIGMPAGLIVILRVLFAANALRPEQLKLPAGIMSAKLEVTTASLTRSAVEKPKEASVVASANTDSSALFNVCTAEIGVSNWNVAFGHAAQPGARLSPDQIRWLVENQKIIENIIQLASTGRVPAKVEQALMDDNDLYFHSVPTFDYDRFDGILAAECYRRRSSGDDKGAAEALRAIHRLARSYGEINLISFLSALHLQRTAVWELSGWMTNEAMTPAAARLVRERIAGQALGLADYRKVLEIDYRRSRARMVQLLNGPFADLARDKGNLPREESGSSLSLVANLVDRPLRTIEGTLGAIMMKSHASGILDQFDAEYRRKFNSIDQIEINSINSNDSSETLWNLVLFQLNMAGLGLIAGDSADVTDPYSGKPLTLVHEPDGAVLIYSVGQNLRDEKGGGDDVKLLIKSGNGGK